MSESGNNVTRGRGMLEGFLSRWRARVADRKIPDQLRSGRLLDIGCGTFPHFLTHAEFAGKYGVDQIPNKREDFTDLSGRPIHFATHDIQSGNAFPFDKDFFSVITMLAIVEHLEPEALSQRLSDVRELLQPGGRLILTTPAGWTHGILKAMSRLGLVSREEIDEHEFQYSGKQLREVLLRGGFADDQIRIGYFEFFMNIWCVCEKG